MPRKCGDDPNLAWERGGSITPESVVGEHAQFTVCLSATTP